MFKLFQWLVNLQLKFVKKTSDKRCLFLANKLMEEVDNRNIDWDTFGDLHSLDVNAYTDKSNLIISHQTDTIVKGKLKADIESRFN